MLLLTQVSQTTVIDLRQRMVDILSRAQAVQRALDGDIDPRWTAIAQAATAHLDAADEAVKQAELAADAGDKARAQRRLNVAQTKLKEASMCLGEWEAEA